MAGGVSLRSRQIDGLTPPGSGGTITGMDPADHALALTRCLLELADDLDLDRGVIGMAMIGAGITVMANVDPVMAERVVGVLSGDSAAN